MASAPEASADTQPSDPHEGTAGEPEVDFNDIFSLRKPKDAKAGLSSGLKSIGKGLLAGAAGLVAAPIVGAHREGWVGAAKGVAAGEHTCSLPMCYLQLPLVCVLLLNWLQPCAAVVPHHAALIKPTAAAPCNAAKLTA